MEQRRLRLGDILDDYCPRERRVTNHAIVAMVEEDVKQTRCTTCDAEHAYKGGKAPRRRKKDTPAALYDEVLAGIPEADGAPLLTTAPEAPKPPPAALAAPEPEELIPANLPAEAISISHEPEPEDEPARPADIEDGPVHRPLIRATLPRPEGQKDARPLPEFTVRHSGTRANGNFRGDPGNKPRGNGHRPPGGQRFSGARSRPGRGPGARGPGSRGPGGGGFRQAQPPRHGGRKRSR